MERYARQGEVCKARRGVQDKERSVRQGEVCEKSSQARPGLVCEAKKVNKVREGLLDKERSVR